MSATWNKSPMIQKWRVGRGWYWNVRFNGVLCTCSFIFMELFEKDFETTGFCQIWYESGSSVF